jgi:hypothetical protein
MFGTRAIAINLNPLTLSGERLAALDQQANTHRRFLLRAEPFSIDRSEPTQLGLI